MSLPRLKICGFTQVQQVKAAANLAIDAVGFIHHAASPRHVEVAQLKRLARAVGPLQQSVGVFVDQPLDRLIEIMQTTGLGLAQLHGSEGRAYLDELDRVGVSWLKALRVKEAGDLAEIEALGLEFVLLDAYSDQGVGGMGKPFDWSLAQAASLRCKVILAGGLTPGNVVRATRAVQLYGLDLSSGVEESPGIKDFALLAQLLQNLGRLPC